VFLGALEVMATIARDRSLSEAIRSERFLQLMVDVWDQNAIEGRRGEVPPRTLLDALVARDYLERFLRPLASPPRKSDLVHTAANGLGAIVGMTAKWEHGTPFILTEHGIYLRERYLSANTSHSWNVDAFMLRFFRHLTAAAYMMADLITPGNLYNQRWELHAGAPQSLIQPIYNGVEPAAFPEITEEPEVPTVSWAGRVDPLKDLETLIRAFGLVHEKIPEARLRMFGSTPAGNEKYRETMEAIIDELGLREAATFEGRVENIVDAYKAGHVVALTSISEGFPYTLIEAMMSGSATVSTDVGGVPEAVGEAGILAPARDPYAVAEGFLRLLQDDDLRWQMRRAARERALEFFTQDEFLSAYRKVYDGLTLPQTDDSNAKRRDGYDSERRADDDQSEEEHGLCVDWQFATTRSMISIVSGGTG